MTVTPSNPSWPEIPGKKYFTIGEVSRLCDVKPHVLRYWEQEFPQLSPCKRRGNRRYYQRQDVLLIRQIKHMLYDEGFTIMGARQRLEQGSGAPVAQSTEASTAPSVSTPSLSDIASLSQRLSQDKDQWLPQVINELEQIASQLRR